jgi:hypothetical protein
MIFQPENLTVDRPTGREYTISSYGSAYIVTERKDKIFSVNKMVPLKRDHYVSPVFFFMASNVLPTLIILWSIH